MPSNLSFLCDLTIEQHRIRYAKDSSQLAPMVFLCRNNTIEEIAILNFRNDDAKQRSIYQIRQKVRTQGYDATVFSSEAWMVENPEFPLRVRPRDSDQRIEVVMIDVRSAQGSVAVALKIERDWSGKWTGFEKIDMSGDTIGKFDFFA